MAPPIVIATFQATVISIVSNVLAQVIEARQNKNPVQIDPIVIFQYALFAAISTPPNFFWQDFLESSFPAYQQQPQPRAKPKPDSSSSSSSSSSSRDRRARLNKRNTLAKTLLDQTFGAAVNAVLFSVFMHAIRAAMAHHYHDAGAASSGSAFQRLGGRGQQAVVRYGAVEWAAVWARSRAEIWPIVTAGWRFWPFVSLVNYAFLTSVAARSLLGNLAGLGWGVYLFLSTGK